MQFGIIGINHKLAEVRQRDLFAKACRKHFGLSAADLFGFSYILLSTCNRTEIYFSSNNLPDTHSYLIALLRQEIQEDFEQKLYSFFGEECFHHLCRVTAGLDSAEFFETEIQGQVKIAYQQASNCQHLPSSMHFLFQKTLKVGKYIRSNHPLPKGLPSLEQVIYSIGNQKFQDPSPSILFVGASSINAKLIAYFKSKKAKRISLSNRSPLRAEWMAKKYEMSITPWGNFNAWNQYDWIIFGTSSPEPLLRSQDLPSCNFPEKLIMDLSVPRNVEAAVATHRNVTLMNIDQLQKLLKLKRSQVFNNVEQIEKVLKEKVELQLCVRKAPIKIPSVI